MKDDYKRAIYLEFLNRCGYEVQEIPPEAWAMFRHYNYKYFIEPMLKEDSKTLSIGKLAIKYRVSTDHVKYILYKKK